MRKSLVLSLLVLLFGCTDVIPEPDPRSQKEIAKLSGEKQVHVVLMIDGMVLVDISGDHFLSLEEQERDDIADKIANIVVRNNNGVRNIVLTSQRASRSLLTTTYTWEIKNGKPLEISYKTN